MARNVGDAFGGDKVKQWQFDQLKAAKPNTLLLFRVGDFYHAFCEQAVIVAEVLGITLTSRGRVDPVPACGIPAHRAESDIAVLIAAGHRVAIGEAKDIRHDQRTVTK